MKERFDVVIIGAGVSGMTAAIYLKRAGINVTIVEKAIPGGQINKAFSVENYPGFNHISGQDLSNNIAKQVTSLGVQIQKGTVVKIESEGSFKKVILKSGKLIECLAIVVAIGRSPKKLDIPNMERFVGRGLSYCAVCDGMFFKGKDVVVVGGSNSALEEALYLADICNNVTVIHRRDTLRAESIYQDKVKAKDNIDIKYQCVLKELVAEDGVVSKAILEYSNGMLEELAVSACFSSIGYEPVTSIFKNMLEIDELGYIKVDEFFETSVKGIFAVGDVVRKELFQLLTAMSDAVVASNSCITYIKDVKK